MVHRVLLNTRAELVSTPPLPKLPPVAKKLDFSCASSRAGSTSLADVEAFFTALEPGPPSLTLPKVEARKLTQRLRRAQPLSKALPMGKLDQGFVHQQVMHTRNSSDMVGVPINREALRQTPRARVEMVLRPGFRERGQAAVALAEDRQRRHEEAVYRARAAVAEQTRAHLREAYDAHRKQTMGQPVLVAAKRQWDEHERFTSLQEAQHGAAEVANLITNFEGMHGGAPPPTPAPPTSKHMKVDGSESSGAQLDGVRVRVRFGQKHPKNKKTLPVPRQVPAAPPVRPSLAMD